MPAMPDFPAHASPAFPPIASPRPDLSRSISDFRLDRERSSKPSDAPTSSPDVASVSTTAPDTDTHDDGSTALPSTSDSIGTPPESDAYSAVAQPEQPEPRLLEVLPEVTCEVRARIPTTTGQEMFLHLYHNSADNKEHLAIVFGPHIRSRSLDAVRPGETEKDRMIRGAYTGILYPGRTSSRLDQIRREAGVGSAMPQTSRSRASSTGSQGSSDDAASTTSAHGDGAHEEYFPGYDLAPPLVRIHSECYTGETVWSARCDCGEQLDEAARLMSLPSTPTNPSAGGVIVYLRQEGRGIGLLSKLKAYNLQDLGHDTMQANLLLRHPADARSYGLATAMLMDLGLGGERGIKLLTNNPEKVRAVEGPNREVRVAERVAMIPLAWKTGGKDGVKGPEVEKYISTKIEKFKHMFSS